MNATLAGVPTNRVTATGQVKLTLRGDTATVTVATHGLLAGSPHLMHIHAGGAGACPPASAARLHNGHRTISTGNGISYYGPTQVSLTEFGSTSGAFPNNVAFPRAPASGNIQYTRTVTVAPIVANLIRERNAVVVIHGIDYNNNHQYDFAALGVSDLDKTFPGEATAPALCGPLRPSGSAPVKVGSVATTFTAALRLAPAPAPTATEVADRFRLFCHLAPVGSLS